MGANQSSNSGQATTTSHGITVVNPTPNRTNENEDKIILPARVPPILSIEGHTIDPKKHPPGVQLNRQTWADLASTIEKFVNSRADLIALRQSQLQEKIVISDEVVQIFTDSYVNDKHRALAKLNESCKKIDEISKTLEKCTIQSELCVDVLKKLNFLLPSDHKLEPLEV